MLLKIGIKNLLGAGLRTWLNVFVTSISFFMIIFMSALYDGMREHAKQVSIDTEIAGGAYWHPNYDPMDPMTFEDAHSKPPSEINKLIDDNEAFPVLVSQASIYPNGRMMPIIMKGIEPNQELINLPTKVLNTQNNSYIPVLIGRGMAKYTNLKEGDTFMLRWLDANKTYDANDGVIIHIMDTENFKIDMGQIWLSIKHLQQMLDMPKEVTYVTYKKKIPLVENYEDWVPRDVKYLIRDMEAIIEADEPNAAVMYITLLILAAIGIFNSQVLSIFRRRKEIGTFMALGMTRTKVVSLFTLEGGLNTFLAMLMTIILFGPAFWYFGIYGIPLPIDYSDMGLIIAKSLIPVYSIGLFISTAIIIAGTVLIVSYLPSRKISKMKPTDALRGKLTV